MMNLIMSSRRYAPILFGTFRIFRASVRLDMPIISAISAIRYDSHQNMF